MTRMTRTTMMKRMNSRIKYLRNSYLMQKGVWWMRNFFSLLNKHRDAVGRLVGQRMLYFQKIGDDTLSQCSQRLVLPVLFAISLFWFRHPKERLHLSFLNLSQHTHSIVWDPPYVLPFFFCSGFVKPKITLYQYSFSFSEFINFAKIS